MKRILLALLLLGFQTGCYSPGFSPGGGFIVALCDQVVDGVSNAVEDGMEATAYALSPNPRLLPLRRRRRQKGARGTASSAVVTHRRIRHRSEGVIPAKAGIQAKRPRPSWMPAFAGMTNEALLFDPGGPWFGPDAACVRPVSEREASGTLGYELLG